MSLTRVVSSDSAPLDLVGRPSGGDEGEDSSMIGPVHRLYAARRPHCRCAGWGQLRGQTSSVTYPIPRQVARFDLKSAGGDSGNRTRDRGFADRCLATWLSRRASGAFYATVGSAPTGRLAKLKMYGCQILGDLTGPSRCHSQTERWWR